MEYHGGLIQYWKEHYNIGLFTILITMIYLIMSYDYISCLVRRHRQQQQISLSGLFFYLIISSEYFYYLMKLHHMDLYAVIDFLLRLSIVNYGLFVLGFFIYLFGMLLLGDGYLGQLLDLLAKFVIFIRKNLLEFMESEFCKKPPET